MTCRSLPSADWGLAAGNNYRVSIALQVAGRPRSWGGLEWEAGQLGGPHQDHSIEVLGPALAQVTGTLIGGSSRNITNENSPLRCTTSAVSR
jgi:hypothetical protein